MPQSVAAGAPRKVCATVSTVATGEKLDGKRTYFTAEPILHENVAHFDPG